MSLIFDKIENSYTQKLPFSVYRKPNSDLISGFFQQNDELFLTKDYTESGFVFSPFDDKDKAVLIPENQADLLSEKVVINTIFEGKNDFKNDILSKEKHIKLIEKAITEINKNTFKKVVVSRMEVIELRGFDLIEVYKRLLQKYPNAFVYVWFHPKVGLWLGASPETLLNISGTFFKTMSLAGTQVYNSDSDVIWKSKEIEEQLLVTEFIKSQLETISSNLQIDKTKTTKAGNLLHLKTNVEGELKTKKTGIKKLIRALHPTPAVCGFPREITKQFIFENEGYDRTFYTGFLGELNLKNNKSSLFVNLRCMKVVNTSIKIYVGGGITKDSNPEKEWEETISKSKVMKSVLIPNKH